MRFSLSWPIYFGWGRMYPYLTEIGLGAELVARPGLIPVLLDAARRQLTWIDLELFHLYQGFFHDALGAWTALRGSNPTGFTTSLDVLPSLDLATCLAPTGFIFHAGRCGSTLLAKVLARSRSHMVFGEAAPHNQVWQALPGDNDAAKDLYRRLILTMGRRRLSSYRAHVIKFTSHNILRFQFIRAVFPDVPALFLFREPGPLLDSYRRARPAWTGEDVGIGKAGYTSEDAVEAFLDAALSIRDGSFRCLDYRALTPESLPKILRFLRLDPSPDDLRLMLSEFSWDAKSGIVPRPFLQAPRGAPLSVPGPLGDMYEQLMKRSRGDW
jgi:hypothetical protein